LGARKKGAIENREGLLVGGYFKLRRSGGERGRNADNTPRNDKKQTFKGQRFGSKIRERRRGKKRKE